MGNNYFEQRINMKCWFKLGKNQPSHHRGWKFGFSAWPWDKAAQHAVEISRLTPLQGSADVKIKSYDNVHLYLWLQRDNAPRDCRTWSYSQSEVLSSNFGTSETAVSLSCTMTTRLQTQWFPSRCFWRKNLSWSWKTLLNYRISFRVTSLPLPTVKNHLKGTHFETVEETQVTTVLEVLRQLEQRWNL